MAQPPQRPWLRVLVPLAIAMGGIGVFWAVLRNTSAQKGPSAPTVTSPAPASTPPADGNPVETTPADAQPPAPAPATPPSASPPVAAQDGELEGLRARPLAEAAPFTPLGSLDPQHAMALLEFSPYGAGLRRVTLARFYDTIKRKPDQHVVLQREHELSFGPEGDQQRRVFTPMAAVQVEVEGRTVNLSGRVKEPGSPPRDVPVWHEIAPGSFECTVENAGGKPILTITRRYVLARDRHTVQLRQDVRNHTGRPLKIKWVQFGPVDIDATPESLAYGGDKRRVRFGYLGSPSIDPARQTVLTAAYETLARQGLFGTFNRKEGGYPAADTAWPRPRGNPQHELAWYGVTDRYFGVAVYPLIDPASRATNLQGPDKVFRHAGGVYRVLLNPWEQQPHEVVMALQTGSPAVTIAPGESADLSMGVYAGPLSTREIQKDPVTTALNLSGLVVFNFGGMCGWCTFAWLAHALLGLLRLLHDWLLFDWALAIIVLVVIVRSILHPVTRWSQIRMARFGKQVQDLGPKQKKLQERYKDDPKKLREEIARLYREEGVNPAGMLGCIPMFLQTPVWIALYAMLYFAFELRQHPAFFGAFQSMSAGKWSFLGDLAEPDRFIDFGRTLFTIPLLNVPFNSINILPLILGVVFYVQQKYLTPPTSATLTPEQEQQQKIMKVMMVVMFPLFMYGAPSGLAIYFITNSSLGIAESKWIRAHMTKHDLLNPAKKPARTGGFLARVQAAMEERQKNLMRQRNLPGRKKP